MLERVKIVSREMERRDFLKNTGLVVAGLASDNLFAAKNQTPLPKADFTLRIAPVSFDIAPAKTIHTLGYNGQVPGPLLRMKEGVEVTVDVFNDTDHFRSVVGFIPTSKPRVFASCRKDFVSSLQRVVVLFSTTLGDWL